MNEERAPKNVNGRHGVGALNAGGAANQRRIGASQCVRMWNPAW